MNDRSTAVRARGPLESPLLSFDLNAEIEQLRREDAWQGGRNSKTLMKHPDFRIVLTVLQAHARLHQHKAAGRISVQTVAGHIQMQAESRVFDLPTGHLLALEREIEAGLKELKGMLK